MDHIGNIPDESESSHEGNMTRSSEPGTPRHPRDFKFSGAD